MTPRARSHAFDASDLPALRAFLAGYLHEDFVAEHRTPDGAVAAFAADSGVEERRQLRDDAVKFLAKTTKWPWHDLRGQFRSLGSAWHPQSRAALTAVLTKLASLKG